MSTYELALLGHLLGVMLIFAGIAVAGVASAAAAARRRRRGEVAVLLRVARTGRSAWPPVASSRP